MDFQEGDSIDVFDAGIEFNEIVPAREDFAKAGNIDPNARLKKRFFVGFAEAGGIPVEFRRGFALVAEAAKEFFVGRRVRQIAEARNVNTKRLCRCAERRF